jgi:hypothetical protein
LEREARVGEAGNRNQGSYGNLKIAINGTGYYIQSDKIIFIFWEEM